MDDRQIRSRGRREIGDDRIWTRCLERAVSHDVIPRLLEAHRADREPTTSRIDAAESDADTMRAADTFLELVLAGDEPAMWRVLQDFFESRLSREAIYLDVMAPAMRHLGGLWEEDRMGFFEVTTKSAAVQRLVSRLSAEADPTPPTDAPGILLAPRPGEQHTCGLLMLAELFRDAGWNTEVEPTADEADLVDLVANERFDAVGLSVGSERKLDGLGALVGDLRAAGDRQARPLIFLGGWAFHDASRSVDGYGADLVEFDARRAVERATDLVMSRTLHGSVST